MLLPVRVVPDHAVDRVEAGPVGVDAEPHRRQRLQHLPLAAGGAGGVERVQERLQVAAGGDLGVELAHAAGAGVARVHVRGPAGGLHLPVQLLEAGQREVDLPPDLELLGQPPGRADRQRDAADRAHVGGHVLAGEPVAAGGGAHQAPVAVRQAHRQAVDLELADVRDLVAGDGPDPLVPGPDLLLLERVLEAEHRPAVLDLDELAARLAAHPLRRRVRRDQVGVLGLEPGQLPVQRVVLGVGELRSVEDVVEVLVPADLPAQLLQAALDVSHQTRILLTSATRRPCPGRGRAPAPSA